MIRRDYLMRVVDEFGKFLAKIIGLKLEGNFEEALDEIDKTYEELMKADPRVLKAIDTDKILDFLQKEKAFNNHYLKMVAELLFEEGQIYIENGDPISARNVMGKAKVLIEYLMENDTTFSFDWYEKLAAIENALTF